MYRQYRYVRSCVLIAHLIIMQKWQDVAHNGNKEMKITWFLNYFFTVYSISMWYGIRKMQELSTNSVKKYSKKTHIYKYT